jgi:hypothetical protein
MLGLEGPGAHGGAQALAVEIAQPAFQGLDGLAQSRQGLVGRAVEPGGPAHLGPAAGHCQTDQRVGGARLHPHPPGQVE